MNKTLNIIYIPGLSDHPGDSQSRLLKRWQKPNRQVHYFSVGWSNDEPYLGKLDRLTKLIDSLEPPIGLVGVSAGAGLTLNAYMARPDKISGVVYVCGELTGFAKINPRYFKANPAFKGSMAAADANLSKLTKQDKAKMLSIRPIIDDIVPVKETQIPGVKSKTVFSVQHILTIGLMLTIYKRIVISFLNRSVK